MDHEHGRKQGVLLINLGSPNSTDVEDVRAYLREFLGDERVIDVPAPVRAAVLELFILPFRPKRSAEAYEKIWTDDGSPLVLSTYAVADKLADRVDVPVAVAMRYGDPSIAEGLRGLANRGVRDLLVVPLYPQYAQSSYETVAAKALEVAREIAPRMRVTIQPPFYSAPDYIEALHTVASEHLEGVDYDVLLHSYHGIPERHIRKGDPSGTYCLNYQSCCERPHPAQSMCYRHQCYETTRLFAERAGIPSSKLRVSFQSRLAGEPWLTPYTDKELERFPTDGIKRIAVMCPAFVSDCLETLEEIAMEGREEFMDAGGKEFVYIPCLNEHDAWIDVLERFVRDFRATRELVALDGGASADAHDAHDEPAAQ